MQYKHLVIILNSLILLPLVALSYVCPLSSVSSFQFPTCTLMSTSPLYLCPVLHLSLFHYLSRGCAIMSLMSPNYLE